MPAKAGIQSAKLSFQPLALDSRFRGSDDNGKRTVAKLHS